LPFPLNKPFKFQNIRENSLIQKLIFFVHIISALGAHERLVGSAGFDATGGQSGDLPFIYLNLSTGWRMQSSTSVMQTLLQNDGINTVKPAVKYFLKRKQSTDGSIRFEKSCRFVLAKPKLNIL